MKKFLIAFAILGSIITTKSFAQSKIPVEVSKSFQASFNEAKDLKWSEVNHLYRADFDLDGQAITAFYNENGNLIASSRNVSTLQLPMSLQTALKSKYAGYSVNDLFEVDNEDGIEYYATMEKNAQRVILKSTSVGDWTKYQKDIL